MALSRIGATINASNTTSGTTHTTTRTVTGGTDCTCFALCFCTDGTLTSSTFALTSGSGGTPAKLVERQNGTRTVAIWGIPGVAAGSTGFQVTWSGTITGGSNIIVVEYTGCDQTTMMDNTATGGTVNTLSITNTTGNEALVAFISNTNPNPMTSGTSVLSDNAEMSAGINAADGSVALTWTTGGRGCCGGRVLAAAAGSALSIPFGDEGTIFAGGKAFNGLMRDTPMRQRFYSFGKNLISPGLILPEGV